MARLFSPYRPRHTTSHAISCRIPASIRVVICYLTFIAFLTKHFSTLGIPLDNANILTQNEIPRNNRLHPSQHHNCHERAIRAQGTETRTIDHERVQRPTSYRYVGSLLPFSTYLRWVRFYLTFARTGNQSRPRIFDLNIRRPPPLYSEVVEVDERVTLVGYVSDPQVRPHRPPPQLHEHRQVTYM